MTLRLRLVLALVALLTVGLGLYGFATYSLYARSQYQRLDDQISSSVNAASFQLLSAGTTSCSASTGSGSSGSASTSTTSTTAPTGSGGSSGEQVTNGNGQDQPTYTGGNGFGPPNGFPGEGPGDHGQHPVNLPPDTYTELRDANGQVLRCVHVVNSSSQPDLPATLHTEPVTSRFFTTDSVSGSGQWRVLLTGARSTDGTNRTIVVAVPLGDVTSSLDQFILIEVLAAVALLAALSGGSWLILRRGLHPLEAMATTAETITAGDLTQRVSPSGGPTEVGQLGLALNTMLDDIEEAFHERDETEQRLRQFLADASHELRTPITSIQGFAELFRVGADHAQIDLPTILRRIEEESARMRLLVEDLLLLAQLDQPRQVEAEPVDLAVLAADACSDAVAAARDRQVTLDAPEPVVVRGDQAHLRQAIANLVANALRHTPAGSPLEVSTRRVADPDHPDQAWGEVSVRDHGPGLSPEALEHVFDRFWQQDRSRTGSGAGLGLSIVSGIAAEHGGTATATNAPDGGAVFTLRLPAL